MSKQQGILIVISGPSGAGKTTITHAVKERVKANFSVSMTTRPMTDKETDGVDYYFVTREAFMEAVEQGKLLEWAEVFGKCYGTPKAPVERDLAEGKDVILEIDVNGGKQIQQVCQDALSIFIMPPSSEVLLDRLRARGREDESIIQERYKEAQREIEDAKNSGAYQHFVLNDNLEKAISEVIALIENRKASAQ